MVGLQCREIGVLRAEVVALRSKAACVAVDMGLAMSAVLSTLDNPTMALDAPLTVPVKVGLLRGAFKSSCDCMFPVITTVSCRMSA